MKSLTTIVAIPRVVHKERESTNSEDLEVLFFQFKGQGSKIVFGTNPPKPDQIIKLYNQLFIPEIWIMWERPFKKSEETITSENARISD